ncbi:WSC domain-containing protein [Aureococcus anophagefferens]|nr:WSC domain-containing protein [Aureococcus anophagefferens]
MHSVFVALLVGAAAAAPRCYVDRVDARQLPHVVCEAGTGDCAALTVRYCAAQCRALDYEVAGVEAGHACVMTYIAAPRWAEGSPGEHMVGMRSTDQGKTWTDFVALEPYSNATTARSARRAAAPEEIFVLASRNLLSEDDPTKVTWEMWPDDDHGIGAVGAYDSPSRVTRRRARFDGGGSPLLLAPDQGYARATRGTTLKFSSVDAWTNSSYAVYEDTWASGSEAWVKQPRGPLSPKKQPNGLWLMTYYNTEPLGAFAAAATVSDRNNMWLTVGREAGGTIKWSQPARLDRVLVREGEMPFPSVADRREKERFDVAKHLILRVADETDPDTDSASRKKSTAPVHSTTMAASDSSSIFVQSYFSQRMPG